MRRQIDGNATMILNSHADLLEEFAMVSQEGKVNLLYQRRFQVQKVAGNVLLRLLEDSEKKLVCVRKHNLRLNRLEMLQSQIQLLYLS